MRMIGTERLQEQQKMIDDLVNGLRYILILVSSWFNLDANRIQFLLYDLVQWSSMVLV